MRSNKNVLAVSPWKLTAGIKQITTSWKAGPDELSRSLPTWAVPWSYDTLLLDAVLIVLSSQWSTVQSSTSDIIGTKHCAQVTAKYYQCSVIPQCHLIKASLSILINEWELVRGILVNSFSGGQKKTNRRGLTNLNLF